VAVAAIVAPFVVALIEAALELLSGDGREGARLLGWGKHAPRIRHRTGRSTSKH
jgi:ABC-type Fe3+ transport system permease subunit